MDLSERGASTARHPWEIARARFFLGVLRDHGLRPRRALDVGAGDAYFAGALRDLSPATEIALWDTHYTPDDLASLRAAGFDARTEKPAGPFDLAILLDVAEHVEDDRGFLADVLASCTADAHVLFSVPAWPALWSAHDDALRHVRRYTPKTARALLDGAGLAVVEAGGVFHSLLAPRAASVARERIAGRSATTGVGAWRGGATVTRAIAAVLDAEGRASRQLSARGLDVPGLSWWALLRRR